ncbi:hypothetical protein ACFFLZ_08115 [Photobacterium aphoticum]|uniref:Uncharacterized protein n=1 Tax=Photobacterium aphoticum TaxID=754436 RepID=A0A0J1GHF5_9GAMM|nr:hypothetical protein [Photobacterium aphoticum]KLU99152.1 hypothetical protein ABT58_19275 [Photobacterium aphoticum]PSU59060.1 hypothetical protein C9I90_04710 [Photobacterium aphoticum]GHA45181.1 hypothetical protein GCM10007086_18400 [Photobacterium aphoticum]
MTNYEHYQSTVEQVNRAIQKEANAPWYIEYRPVTTSVRQAFDLVSPAGIVCQQLELDAAVAHAHWPEKSAVEQHVLDYVVRGAARLAPLRQTAFRNNIPQWLTQSLQQVHHVTGSSERLLSMLNDPAFPYPSQVNLDGIYLPCWVWHATDDETGASQASISVIDRRTGYFSAPRSVSAAQLVDQEKWLGAQVIDSVDESIETIRYYVDAHRRSQHHVDFDEPSITEALRHPCAATLSPFMSVGLVMLVVIGFFITFKWLLGF